MLPPTYFDALYDSSADPWGFEDRWYEQRKRALTLALLPAPHYRRVFEPGCSIGVLTRELAPRCDSLLATDVAQSAVAATKQRCAELPHVQVERTALPEAWPEGDVDLVVLSEVVYYLSCDEATALAQKVFASAHTAVAVHWRHEVPDYPLSGDEVHGLLDGEAERAGLTRLALHVEPDLIAAVWSRDSRSVAEQEGLT